MGGEGWRRRGMDRGGVTTGDRGFRPGRPGRGSWRPGRTRAALGLAGACVPLCMPSGNLKNRREFRRFVRYLGPMPRAGKPCRLLDIAKSLC